MVSLQGTIAEQTMSRALYDYTEQDPIQTNTLPRMTNTENSCMPRKHYLPFIHNLTLYIVKVKKSSKTVHFTCKKNGVSKVSLC